jgi:hypothetical protein
MGIPSVSLLSNQPGGAVPAAMNALNSYANNVHLRKINAVKELYAPTTVQAETASKLAYANLMAPQFIAKAMNNPDFMAQLSDRQKNQLRDLVYGAGARNIGSNSLNNLPESEPQYNGTGQASTNNFSGRMKNALHAIAEAFHPTKTNTAPNSMTQMGMQQPRQQFVPNPPNQNQASGTYNPQNEPTPENNIQPGEENPNSEELDLFHKWLISPEGKAEINKGERAHIPDGQELIEWEKRQNPVNPMKLELNKGQNLKSWAEKTGEQEGIKAEGKAAGITRNKDIEKLNTNVFNSKTNQATLDQISDILASPTFEKIRSTPLAGHHELAYYAKEGTPEEQDMVGKYYTLTGNLIKDASRDFAGQFRKGEQQLLNGMKPSPGDTVDTAKGKTETLSILNRMLAERSRLTSKIMEKYHVNKLEASEKADELIDGDKIRQEVHDRLHPEVTLRNPKTGITITLPILEARKRGAHHV